MANIIFDFDGTIADSFAVIVDIFHELLGRDKRATPKEIDRLRQLPAMRIAKELEISMLRVPWLLMRGRRIMTKRLEQVPVHAGMAETIKQLHGQGHHLFVMSSNSTQNVQQFLAMHQLDTYFAEVYGGVGITAKPRALRRIIKRHRWNRKDCLYIGDETRDVEAAKAATIHCIAVTWGFNARDLLVLHDPTVVVEKPSDLPAAITRAIA